MAILKIRKGQYEGKYRIRIQPVDPVTGKRVAIPVEYADTRKEAKEKEKARLAEIKARQDAAKSRAEKANKANEEAKQSRQKAQEQTDSGTTESQ